MNDNVLYVAAVAMLVVTDVLLVLLGYYLHQLRRQPEPVVHERIELPPPVDVRSEMAPMVDELRAEIRTVAQAVTALAESLSRAEIQQRSARDAGVGVGPASRGGLQVAASGSVQSRQLSRKTFDQANKLAMQGADIDELMNLCGLTRGEAELIRILSGTEPSHETPRMSAEA